MASAYQGRPTNAASRDEKIAYQRMVRGESWPSSVNREWPTPSQSSDPAWIYQEKLREDAFKLRISQRQKQIQKGKNTDGYRRYIKKVPRERRLPTQPSTPNPYSALNKKPWDREYRAWRRQLHDWDDPAQKALMGGIASSKTMDIDDDDDGDISISPQASPLEQQMYRVQVEMQKLDAMLDESTSPQNDNRFSTRQTPAETVLERIRVQDEQEVSLASKARIGFGLY